MQEILAQYGIIKTKEWEIEHSSLKKIAEQDVTYEECRRYACEDIVKRTTKVKGEKQFVLEIPAGSEFHFMGRVDTRIFPNDPENYYRTFEEREFVAFSTINSKNISRYKGRVFYIYDILPEDIVHIFPADSGTKTMAKLEEELTYLPSLWLTLSELEGITEKLQVYNQITCRTKRDGQIIRPIAVLSIDGINRATLEIAKAFGIGIVNVHPEKDAINYDYDLLGDFFMLKSVSEEMNKLYGMDLMWMYYPD